jgi:hypothetical protein
MPTQATNRRSNRNLKDGKGRAASAAAGAAGGSASLASPPRFLDLGVLEKVHIQAQDAPKRLV